MSDELIVYFDNVDISEISVWPGNIVEKDDAEIGENGGD